MKIRNKILFVILIFASILIFNKSEAKAATYTYTHPSTILSSFEELSYDFIAKICESSDKSKFPADYSEANYPYTFIIQRYNSRYDVYVSNQPIRVIFYDSNNSGYMIPFVLETPNSKCFSYYYNYSSSNYFYNISSFNNLLGSSGRATGFYCNHAVKFVDPPVSYRSRNYRT